MMRHSDHSCLPFLLLFLLPPLLCGAAEYTYYVKPTNTTQCPAEPCLTLMQYVQNASEYFKSGAAMIFLPGNHMLKKLLVVSNVTNLTLISANGTHNTTILCRDENFTPYNAYLHFNDTENLIIDGLRFLSCGTAYYSKTESLISLGTLQLTNVVNIQVSNISVEDSLHEGIQGINAFLGKSSITCSCFHDNGGSSPHVSIRFSDPNGAVPASGSNTLTIEDTVLVHGTGGAISLALAQHGYSVDVTIINLSTTGCALPNDSELVNETGIDISLDAGPYPNSSVFIGNSSISNHSFGGISIRGTFSPSITIENTTIAWNHGRRTNAAGLTLIGNSQPVTFRNVTFTNNVFFSPAERLSTTLVTVMLVSVQNVGFYDCDFRSNLGSVALRSSMSVNFTDCNFLSNYDSGVLVDNSNLTVSGTVNFTGNHGVKGGALALYEDSRMLLENDTVLLFTSNNAQLGGAIYVYETDAVPSWETPYDYDCFIKLANPLASNITLTFTDNTAGYGGDSIYGGLLHKCQLFPNYTVDPVDIINSFFHFTPALNESISSMASNPTRVCLCRDGKPDCLVVFSEETVYPGQTLTVNATVVGERFRVVKGIVYAQPQNILLEDFQYSQAGTPTHGYPRCTELQYTIFSSKKQGLLALAINSEDVAGIPTKIKDEVRRDVAEYNSTGKITERLLQYLIHITITLRSCPPGFTLAQDEEKPLYSRCVCNPQLQNIICNISDQTIHLSGTMWVNASFNESGSNGLIIGEYCPFDYCKSEEHDVNLENPDTQCNFDHSGVLCGGCQPGLSLALGSSQCLSCSDKYLVLLIPFAVAGIALVVFIVIFNLTVSEGTINGLIFYANIVGADRTIFFPAHQTNPLTVFIAWLNLDLGIETCFFDNLNAYWKTWLQFVFPLYIWTIIGIIIVLSKHSNFARKIFGNKSPHVLATLLLISYAKLLRTIISTLSFTYLEYPDHTRVAVWALDGNVRYLSGKHVALFLVALAFLLLLCLPLTAILLFWQVLQRLSHYKVIQWIVIKRKPFFDTYFGPLKDEHRYWVGLFLLIRSVLLIIFAVTPSYATKVDLLSINTIIVVLLVYIASLPHIEHAKEGRARNSVQPFSLSQKIRERLKNFSGSYYKNWCLSLLENSFLLNLGVLSAASLYIRSSDGNQAAVVYTSVSIAFTQFVGIVFFHAHVVLRKWWKNRMERTTEQVQQARAGYEEINDGPEDLIRAGPRLRTLDFTEYREPILGHYDSYN